MSEIKPPLMVIVGPTAVGKTAVSLRLALALDGEIVSADSRQVYRGMDIGTAKATAHERARVPHHLIDVVDPSETLTLAQFQRLAYAAIDGILARGRLPLLVGGSGQYVRAVIEGWRPPEVAPQAVLREALEKLDTNELARWLALLDPVAAEGIDLRNRRRLIRALEVTLVTGRPISVQQRKSPPSYRVLQIGLTLERTLLYQRIDARVDRMMELGLLDETHRLAERYGWDVPAMSGLGYAQLGAYLRSEMTLEEAVAAIKRETRRFVRQQANWFKPGDPSRDAEPTDQQGDRLAAPHNVRWFHAGELERAAGAVEQFVRDWLANQSLLGG
jgi:tRNA dimethylallyltransferase